MSCFGSELVCVGVYMYLFCRVCRLPSLRGRVHSAHAPALSGPAPSTEFGATIQDGRARDVSCSLGSYEDFMLPLQNPAYLVDISQQGRYYYM